MQLERIVIGIDFSPASIDAAQWVATHLAPRSELVLTHVIAVPEPAPSVAAPLPRRDPLVDTVREGAEHRLREIGRTLNADFVWREIREGEPAECLTKVAAEFSADVVVVGAHGERVGTAESLGTTAEQLVRISTGPVLLVTHARREAGTLRRALLGSVVDGVLRGAACPVLVVPQLPARAERAVERQVHRHVERDGQRLDPSVDEPAAARSDRNSDTFSAVSTPTSA